MRKRIGLLPSLAPLALMGTSPTLQAQIDFVPDPGDVASLDAIMAAYYEIVSGPAGEPADRQRDEYIHIENAQVGFTILDDHGNQGLHLMTIGRFHEMFGGPRREPFYERELHRVTQRFGAVVHIWSTYESSREPGGEAFTRGINSIQLYFDGERWWVTSWIFDQERDDNPIPAEYLP